MSSTTLTKASKCPKCHQTGELVKKAPTTDPKYTGYIYKCGFLTCLWYDTTWAVTADENDKVEMMDIGHAPRVFPDRAKITDEQRKRLRETFDDT